MDDRERLRAVDAPPKLHEGTIKALGRLSNGKLAIIAVTFLIAYLGPQALDLVAAYLEMRTIERGIELEAQSLAR